MATTMRIKETWVDRTRGRGIGDSGWYEPFTEERGRLYRALVREHGRCTSKVYIDRRESAPDDGTTGAFVEHAEPIGWVFVKRQAYEDAKHGETFVRETWVEVQP